MLKWLLKWFSAHPMAHVPDITVERPSDAAEMNSPAKRLAHRHRPAAAGT